MSPFPSITSVLTEDLLSRINDKLDDDSDRKTWRLVCKEFFRVDSLCRASLRVLRVEFLPSLLSRFTNIHALDLSVCPRIDDGTVLWLLGRGESGRWVEKVRSLNLSRATGLKFSGLEILARVCRGVETLDVSYCRCFGDREAAAVSYWRGLKELRMDKCLGVSDVGLAKIAVGCGKLERLSLKWCMEISDLGIDLLCKKCHELKYLDVSYLKVTSQALCSIACLPKLEGLTMVGCPLVNDEGLQFLGDGCPLLQEFDVSRCESVSLAGLVSLIRGHAGIVKINAGYCFSEISFTLLDCIKNLKDLKTIKIDGARVSDLIFETMSCNCNIVTEIGLSKCVGVTNMGILQLVSGCVNLKRLDLTCCRSITDATISTIADSCRNLVCLKLESCNMISEKSLEMLGSCCQLLEELDLTDCCGVNDKGLQCLSRCSRLHCLKLGLCTNISDKGLLHIASNCSMLQELDLYRCTSIGDDTLAALASGCKKLKKLNISYCTEITDKGMKFLGCQEDLHDLEVRGLEKITSVGLMTFAAGSKKLADLDMKHCGKISDSGFWALTYYSWNLRQINLSYTAITDVALCMVMGNLARLQDAKLVHLINVTLEGFEVALRACYVRIKKVKLDAHLRFLLSSEILENLQSRGCRIRWD